MPKKKTEVAVYLYIHGEWCIPVQAIQMVKKLLQLLWLERPDDKIVIKVSEPAQRFVGGLC